MSHQQAPSKLLLGHALTPASREAPSNTFRAWVIGMLATTIVSAVNMLFSLRNPTINIYVYVVQLLAYPLGVFMAWVRL